LAVLFRVFTSVTGDSLIDGRELSASLTATRVRREWADLRRSLGRPENLTSASRCGSG
jgi:hypothetical protein